MAAKSMDAISSFTSLLQNVSAWRDQVSTLIKHTTQRNEEFKADYNRIVQQAKPRKPKSASLQSIHTTEQDTNHNAASRISVTPTPPNPVDIDPLVAGNRYIYAQANRKRKPGTSFRSGASGPVKFRSKQAVVIYYDSHVQDEFESLVKSFGACRNNLRKGKMAYTVSRGFQLPNLRRGHDSGSSNSGSDQARAGLARRPSPKLPNDKDGSQIHITASTGEIHFTNTDHELEKCQNLCETAAHQFLRDGDCRLELDTVLKSLDIVSSLAQATLDTIRDEPESADRREDTNSNAGSTLTTSGSTLVEKSSREHFDLGQKLSLGNEPRAISIPSLSMPVTKPSVVEDIEADDEDDDGSSIDIDIGRYRLNNPARLRA